MSVWLQLVLRCIHPHPLQFISYCEQPHISRAAVLKLLLLEVFCMVTRSVIPIPCSRCAVPAADAAFRTAPVWLRKEKRQDGISSRKNIGHFTPFHSCDSKKKKKKFAGNEKKSFSLPLCFFYSHHVSHLFFPSTLILALQVTGVSRNMLCFPT